VGRLHVDDQSQGEADVQVRLSGGARPSSTRMDKPSGIDA
jgi:hypothetical protein